MKNGIFAIIFGSLAPALFTGCTQPASGQPGADEAQPDPGDVTDATALLRVDVEAGHAVAFYEPTPGGLFMAETKAPGQNFVLTGGDATDPLRAYARLRPQTQVPAALQAAVDRARDAAGQPGAAAPPAFGGGQPESAQAVTPGVVQQALTSSSSAANFVNNDGGCDWGRQGSFCRVNWANGFFASLSPTTSGLCIVDHYAGNGVVVQITAGATITSVFQAAGTIAQYSLGVAGPSELRRIDVTNASGDSFHAGCRWGN